MFDLTVISCTAFLAILVVFVGFIVISREEESGVVKLRDTAILERDAARKELVGATRDIAYLTGELSKAKNTLALSQTDEAAKKTGEPVRAKTAAEVRKAVERRNAEEMEKHGD